MKYSLDDTQSVWDACYGLDMAYSILPNTFREDLVPIAMIRFAPL